ESVLAHFRDLFERGGNIAVLVQVADDRFRRVAYLVRHDGDAQLRAKIIAQRDRGGKKSLERRLFDRLGSRTLVSRVEVVVEKGAEIDLVERIGGRRGFEQRV